MERIGAYILTGGQSSRMGTPKARLKIGGYSFVEIAARALGAVSEDIKIVGGVIRESDEWATIPDVVTCGARGPLVGIYSALSDCSSAWAFVLACDMPFVSADLIAYLASVDRVGFDAVVPMQANGRAQPICALYRRATCLAAADELIRGEDRSLHALLERIRVRPVPFSSFEMIANSKDPFMNVNTPEDLRIAEARYLNSKPLRDQIGLTSLPVHSPPIFGKAE